MNGHTNVQAQGSHGQIRPANRMDLLELVRLSDQLGYNVTREQVDRALQRILPSEDHALIVAEKSVSQLAGWVHVFLRPLIIQANAAELGGLIVDESSRRLGIGRALLQAAETWAAEQGVSHLMLRSNTARQVAKSFYLSCDYKLIKTSNTFRKELAES